MDTPRSPRGFDVRIIPFISHLYDCISFVTRLDSPRFRPCTHVCYKNRLNKNAFQYDAYRPLVARISQHVLLPGGVPARGVPARGCTCPGGCTCQGVYLPEGCTCQWVGYLPRYSSPLWTEWQTGTKILPCPKIHLRAGKIASNDCPFGCPIIYTNMNSQC